MKGKTHDLNHDFKFSAHTINCVCHSIRSMFRVLGIYSFASQPNHTSHTKVYYNEFVANALRDKIGIVNFDL